MFHLCPQIFHTWPLNLIKKNLNISLRGEVQGEDILGFTKEIENE